MGISTQTPQHENDIVPSFQQPNYYLSNTGFVCQSSNFPTAADRVTELNQSNVRVNGEWVVALGQGAEATPGRITLNTDEGVNSSISVRRSVATVMPLGPRYLRQDWPTTPFGIRAFDTHDLGPIDGLRFMRQPVLLGGGRIVLPSGNVFNPGGNQSPSAPASVNFTLQGQSSGFGLFEVFRTSNEFGEVEGDVIALRVSTNGPPTVLQTSHPEPYEINYSIRLWPLSGLGQPQIELIMNDISIRPRATGSAFSLILDLLSSSNDGSSYDYEISDYEYALPERADVEIGPFPAVSCTPETTVNDGEISFSVSGDESQPQTVAEIRPMVVSSGIYAITFESEGYFPDLLFEDFHGRMSKITPDIVANAQQVGEPESPWHQNRAGYYFRSYSTLARSDANSVDRKANFPAAIKIFAPPGASGSVRNIKISSVAEISFAHRYEEYRSPLALPHHLTGGQHIIVHTGEPINFVPIPPASLNHEPRVESGIRSFSDPATLTYDEETGVLSGSFGGVAIFRFLEMSIKVFSRFIYPTFQAGTILLDPNSPAVDGSIGHVFPEFTDNRDNGFVVELDYGTLPDGYVLEPTGEIWHPGFGLRNESFVEGPVRFRLTADDGTVLWSPNYGIGQERPNLPDLTYPRYTNDPSGTRTNQIHWDTRFPAGEFLPDRTFFLHNQPATFEIVGGGLPAGITLDRDTGRVSGEFSDGQTAESGTIDILLTNYQSASRVVRFAFFWTVVAN